MCYKVMEAGLSLRLLFLFKKEVSLRFAVRKLLFCATAFSCILEQSSTKNSHCFESVMLLY